MNKNENTCSNSEEEFKGNLMDKVCMMLKKIFEEDETDFLDDPVILEPYDAHVIDGESGSMVYVGEGIDNLTDEESGDQSA